jgi:hypothetical protein
MSEITNGVGTKQWIEKSKDMRILAYIPDGLPHDATAVLSSEEKGDSEKPFTKKLFRTALKRASRRVSEPAT